MRAALFDMDAAAKHLFRNLHDATALRVNPLVQHFFDMRSGDGSDVNAEDALANIREAVTTTIHRIFEEDAVGRAHVQLARQHEIVIRCELGGKPDKVVQDQMGLERRQFYREKKRARLRVANALKALIPTSLTPSAAISVNANELEMAYFRALRDTGDPTYAIALGGSLLRDTDDTGRKLELASLLVECYAENGSWAQASDMLEFARRLGCEDARSRSRLAWAQCQLAWYQGSFATAETYAEGAIEHTMAIGEWRTAIDDELLTFAHLQLAQCRRTSGGFESAIDALQAAREIVAARPDLPMRVKVNLFCHLGAGLATMPGCLDAAERHLQEAYWTSTRHGLVRDACETALNLANVYLLLGEIDRALSIGRQGLAISPRVRGRADHAWNCLAFAAVEIAAGNALRAIELAQFAASMGSAELPRAALARAVEADALLRLGKTEEARRLAESATEALRAGGPGRLLAYALRVLSDAAHRSGEPTRARNAILESHHLHERFGHPYGLASALKSRATITGEVRYERQARDLFAALRRH
jgi:tetratricopeptide (TPR) repeat protein